VQVATSQVTVVAELSHNAAVVGIFMEGGLGRDVRGDLEKKVKDATVEIVNAKVGTSRNEARGKSARASIRLGEPGARRGNSGRLADTGTATRRR